MRRIIEWIAAAPLIAVMMVCAAILGWIVPPQDKR